MSNTDDGASVAIRDEWLAFDALPAKLRHALANAAFDWSAQPFAEIVRKDGASVALETLQWNEERAKKCGR